MKIQLLVFNIGCMYKEKFLRVQFFYRRNINVLNFMLFLNTSEYSIFTITFISVWYNYEPKLQNNITTFSSLLFIYLALGASGIVPTSCMLMLTKCFHCMFTTFIKWFGILNNACVVVLRVLIYSIEIDDAIYPWCCFMTNLSSKELQTAFVKQNV